MEDNNLETRVKRLEILHIWGVTALVIFVAGYYIYKRTKK